MARSGVRIVKRDTGMGELRKQLKSRPGVTVGVHADKGAEPHGDDDDGLTVADIAGIHEYGLGVPERSWLRDFVDQNRAELLQMLAEIPKVALKGGDMDQAMERFGLVVVGMVKERIIAGIEPPLAPETLLEKERVTGSPKETPLIRFGQLIASITHEVV